ncbi:MAG: SGNH/GDSL hydrolase family protein [Thermoleophilia bacterium]
MRITVPAIAVLLAAPALLTATAAAQDVEPASYVALGDSYASGEGAAPDTYLPGTSFPDPTTGGRSSTGCHRSSTSWAFRVQTRLGSPALTFVACSGATAADLTAPDDQFAALGEREPPQIDAVTSATTVATLSIGGNDAGFDRVLRACAYRPEDPGNAACAQAGSAAQRTARAGLRGLQATLAGAYVTVASRMAPGGRLLVVGYPRPFAEGGRGYRADASVGGVPACRIGVTPLRTPVRVTRTGARFLNAVAGDLNGAAQAGVAQAVARLRAADATQIVAFVASDPAFRGHRLCTAAPWINGVRLTALGAPKRTSLHPGPKGQAAYARAVGAALVATPGGS